MRTAVIGAAGALGQELVKALAENARALGLDRHPPLLFDVGEAVGELVDWLDDEDLEIEELAADELRGLEAALVAVPEKAVQEVFDKLRPLGIVGVDASRLHRKSAPLFVSQLTGLVGAEKGVIALPSAEALMVLRVLAPLLKFGPEKIRLDVLRPASAAGQAGIAELAESSAKLLNGQEPDTPMLPHRLAFNLVPQAGAFVDAETEVESDLAAELALLLGEGRAAPKVAASVSWAPWFYGTYASLSVGFASPLTPELATETLKGADGVKILDNPNEAVYPMPSLAAGDESVLVGRIRKDSTEEHGLRLVMVLDNLRASADNAVSALKALSRDLKTH